MSSLSVFFTVVISKPSFPFSSFFSSPSFAFFFSFFFNPFILAWASLMYFIKLCCWLYSYHWLFHSSYISLICWFIFLLSSFNESIIFFMFSISGITTFFCSFNSPICLLILSLSANNSFLFCFGSLALFKASLFSFLKSMNAFKAFWYSSNKFFRFISSVSSFTDTGAKLIFSLIFLISWFNLFKWFGRWYFS